MIIPRILDFYKLRRQQWLGAEELEKIQQEKLLAMIHHAYQNVRYYRRAFDSAGISPEDIKTVDDLANVPITRREDLQQLPFEDITASNFNLKGCKRLLTAGSSGMPLTVYRTGNEDDFFDTVWARTFLEDGQNIFDKIAEYHFYQPIPHRWFEHLGIWSRTVLSVLDEPKKHIETLRRVRPDVMRGNPFDLVNTAIALQQAKIQEVNPRLIFSMGSLLDQPSRGLMESILGAEVFDCYGATETGCVAWECTAHRGYHMNVDTTVVELINEGELASKGQRGRIVCTGLHSFSMPFIRYDTGDVGILSDEKCQCGRALPLLKSLDGRADDFFVSADGTLNSPSVIVNQIKLITGIQQFKVIQETETTVTAQIVPNKNASPETSERVRETMKKIMGNSLDVQVELVDNIPPDPSGKRRSLVSRVKKEF